MVGSGSFLRHFTITICSYDNGIIPGVLVTQRIP